MATMQIKDGTGQLITIPQPAAAPQPAANCATVAIASDQVTQLAQETGGNLAAIAAGLGTDGLGITPPTGGGGVRGWVSGIFNKVNTSIAVTGTFFQAVQPVSFSTLPLPDGASQDGTDATGITPPAGGVGIRGWLSGLFGQLGQLIGSVASPATGVLSIQGAEGGTAVPISGTVSASFSGFTPGGSYATIAVSTTSSNVALPTGPTSVVYNTGAYPAYIKFGSSGVVATTSDDVIQPNAWMAFAVGTYTTLAAITASNSTNLNISGGTGFPTGSIGGAGTGTGSAVTAASGAFVDGAIATLGAQADAAWSGTGSATGISVLKAISGKLAGSLSVTGTFWQATQPVSLSSLPALAAGSNAIGSVSVSNLPSIQPVSGTVTANAGTGTFPISAVSLPLPANAAQETGGNLATIAIANGAPSDATWSGSGNGSEISILKAVVGKLSAPLATSISGTVPVSGTFWQATQPVSLTSLPALSSGANTIGAVTQASGPWTGNQTQIAGAAIATAASGIQKVGIVGNAGAAFDAAGQNATAPPNAIIIGGQFNTTPTTVVSGNVSPLQIDSSANLKVTINTAVLTKPASFVSAGASQMGLSVASSAVSLTVPSGATLCQICVEGAAIRYRDDGTAPTASSGIPCAAGQSFQYAGPMSALRFIAQSGAATIDVASIGAMRYACRRR